ncbi:MAG: thiamine biosynthesis protein ThiS [Thermoplasmata archaeon]|nr:thiamine biosynthesis protein ThiS [Thermoplasmata archaeon]
MISVTVRGSRSTEVRQVALPDSPTGLDLLRSLAIPVDSALLLRDGRPIADDEGLSDRDEIEVVIVSSGG